MPSDSPFAPLGQPNPKPSLDPVEPLAEYEITIRVTSAAHANQVLSWIVRSQVYDVVTSMAVGALPPAPCADSRSGAA